MQVYTGAETCLVTGGLKCASWGIPLMAQGANNLWENGHYLLYRKNIPGCARQGYRKIATTLGMNEDAGDYAYAAVDFSLSGYAIAQKVFRPREKSWRLLYTMNNDFIYGWQTMGVLPLFSEMIADFGTISSVTDEFLEKRMAD